MTDYESSRPKTPEGRAALSEFLRQDDQQHRCVLDWDEIAKASYTEAAATFCIESDKADGLLADNWTKEAVAHQSLQVKHRRVIHVTTEARNLLARFSSDDCADMVERLDTVLAGASTNLPEDAPGTLPISLAQNISDLHNQQQVVILAWDGQQAHCVTYGASLGDSDQAAQAGDRLKTVLGWPESLKGMLPIRLQALHNDLLECQASLTRRLQTIIQLQFERDQLREELAQLSLETP